VGEEEGGYIGKEGSGERKGGGKKSWRTTDPKPKGRRRLNHAEGTTTFEARKTGVVEDDGEEEIRRPGGLVMNSGNVTRLASLILLGYLFARYCFLYF
jgi:hypothetical protein